MFELKESYIDAKFGLMAAKVGARTLARPVAPGQPVVSHDVSEFEVADHDRKLFMEQLTGRSSSEALEIFNGFRSQLKLKGLRELTDEEFRAGFLNEYH